MSDLTTKQVLQALLGNGTWIGLYGATLVLALVLPRLRARGWLIGTAATFLATQLWHTVGQIVLAVMDTGHTYRHFWMPSWPLTATISAAGMACLILFVYAQRTTANDQLPVGDILFSFHGRIARRHFWLGSCATGLVGWAPLSSLLGSSDETEKLVATVAYVLWLLLVIWPALALQTKRWHDRGKSGWMILVNLIPIIGPIWAFIETGCLPGTAGPNAYGDDPLAMAPQEPRAPALSPPTPPATGEQAWRAPDFQ